MSPDAYVGVASTYLKANRIGDARRAADELARRFPGSQSADVSDAFVSYAEGRRDQTREILRRVGGFHWPEPHIGYTHTALFDLLEGRVAAWERGMRATDSLVGSRSRGYLRRNCRRATGYSLVPTRGSECSTRPSPRTRPRDTAPTRRSSARNLAGRTPRARC